MASLPTMPPLSRRRAPCLPPPPPSPPRSPSLACTTSPTPRATTRQPLPPACSPPAPRTLSPPRGSRSSSTPSRPRPYGASTTATPSWFQLIHQQERQWSPCMR
uniref:Helicase, putative n=1 Tax=Arundo donax TaxID=35708 RepID=A0A0A9CY44_ARUDO